MEFGNVVKQLRKEKGVNQEKLAELCGVSVQAVSKWECEMSCPDIELLPTLANYFNVTIDYLLTGSNPSSAACNTELPNDETKRIVQYKGQRLITRDLYDPSVKILLKAEDTISGPVEIWGSADIEGNISGGLEASGGVNCGNIEGDINCDGDIHCAEIIGNIQNCKSIYINKKTFD